MTIYLVAGFLVAVIGFRLVEYCGKRWGRDATLYSMIAVIGVSLGAPIFFPDSVGASMYQMTWMFGMMVMVLLGMVRRQMKSRNSGKD